MDLKRKQADMAIVPAAKKTKSELVALEVQSALGTQNVSVIWPVFVSGACHKMSPRFAAV